MKPWYHGNLNDDVMNCWHSLSQWNNAIQLTNSQIVWFSYCWCHSAIASCLLAMAVFSIAVLKYHMGLWHWAEWVPRWPTSYCIIVILCQNQRIIVVWCTLYTVYITMHVMPLECMFNQKTCCHPCMPLTPCRTAFFGRSALWTVLDAPFWSKYRPPLVSIEWYILLGPTNSMVYANLFGHFYKIWWLIFAVGFSAFSGIGFDGAMMPSDVNSCLAILDT